jgi:hypothetical protein
MNRHLFTAVSTGTTEMNGIYFDRGGMVPPDPMLCFLPGGGMSTFPALLNGSGVDLPV